MHKNYVNFGAKLCHFWDMPYHKSEQNIIIPTFYVRGGDITPWNDI